MADSNGKLSDQDRLRIHDWLSSRNINRKCPECRKGWRLPNPYLMFFSSAEPLVVQPGSVTHPVVLLHCLTCGHTSLFSAVQMGIVMVKEEVAQDG